MAKSVLPSKDDPFMQRALALAQANLGQTWPNPSVGAVIVKDGLIVGEGATAKGGRPHAETVALDQAGERAKGATLYVTLEPCTHYGRTPPCTKAIIESGISECIISCHDPNPRVTGGGVEQLRAAGIRVIEGIGSNQAQEIHKGFFSVIEKNRPFIATKIATSKDGKIAYEPGVRTSITGENAILHGQKLRAEFDAIMTGIGTVLADDPQLNVRIPGMEHRSPVRIVLDSHNRMPATCRMRQTEQKSPIWVYTRNDDVMQALTGRGITRVLIEAGHGVNTHFMKNGLIDRVYWYQSPKTIGPQGLDAFEGGIQRRMAHWQKIGRVELGEDVCEIYEKASH